MQDLTVAFEALRIFRGIIHFRTCRVRRAIAIEGLRGGLAGRAHIRFDGSVGLLLFRSFSMHVLAEDPFKCLFAILIVGLIVGFQLLNKPPFHAYRTRLCHDSIVCREEIFVSRWQDVDVTVGRRIGNVGILIRCNFSHRLRVDCVRDRLTGRRNVSSFCSLRC